MDLNRRQNFFLFFLLNLAGLRRELRNLLLWRCFKSMKIPLLAVFCLSLLPVAATAEPRKNHLAGEASLYLRNHSTNPVDWFPWGDEAFAKAKAENKPILLSVGYSTCHWCHVMERESFQNEEIAALLNRDFVCIKVDREERPDIDEIYMRTFQAATGQGGGWPLNVFLTPELEFFTGGTYFPPVAKDGLPGFDFVLKQIATTWKTDSKSIRENTKQMQKDLLAFFNQEAAAGEVVQRDVIAAVMRTADRENGGFGSGEKFPQVSTLRMLLATGDAASIRFVRKTADAMLMGGIYDHVNGGFHRYTVDAAWEIPHFEKMLYDQGQLTMLYTELWQLTKEARYERIVKETAAFVLREMRLADGTFGSALDAQSEGKEGKFYIWLIDEMKAVLNAEEYALVEDAFGIAAAGNFEDHSDPEPLKNRNVLYYKKGKQWSLELAVALEKLHKARAATVSPAFDEKAMASWNGLMISGLAHAGLAFPHDGMLEAAERAHAALWKSLWDEDAQTLGHCKIGDEIQSAAQASSVSLFLVATLDLYEATLKDGYLSQALKLAASLKANFYDQENGGFFESAQRDDVVIRMKGEFDGAIPTSSSVGYDCFRRLQAITGREEYGEIAERTQNFHLGSDAELSQAYTEMLRVYFAGAEGKSRLVLAGDADEKAQWLHAIAKSYQPGLLVLAPGAGVNAFDNGLPAKEGRVTAYFCQGMTCDLPVTEIDELVKKLGSDALPKLRLGR